jgi:hypothetical protein
MKKVSSILLLVVAMLAIAPRAHAEFRWGATAGFNVSKLHFKQDLIETDYTIGYSAGAIGEMMFPGIGFGLDFGFLYDQTGGTANLGQKLIWSSEGYGNERIYLHNFSIPLHLRFKYTRLNGFEDRVAPFVFAGPEFNFKLATSKCEAIKYSGGNLGLTVGVGGEFFKRWQLSLAYTWGMTYALKTKLLEDFSAQTRQWTVRATYFF